MSHKTIPVPKEIAEHALIDKAKYDEMYARSLKDPDGFWGEHGKRIDWIKPFSKVMNVSYDPENLSIKWYEDGVTNVAANCIDRHLETRGDQVAIIWEGDDPSESKEITYKELHGHVCRLANALKRRGREEGRHVWHDLHAHGARGCLAAMLACARIGAVHSVVFGGLLAGPCATASSRAASSNRSIVITADEGTARREECASEAPTVDGGAGGVPGIVRDSVLCVGATRRARWTHEAEAGMIGTTLVGRESPDCPCEP